MADPTSAGGTPALPTRPSLDRAALERVLARAAAMQAASPEDGEAISEAQLMEIAREVGLDPAHVQLAAAEERARAPIAVEAGLATTLAGPALSSGHRVVRGSVPETLQAIERWMTREEKLAVQRRFPDRLTFERRESAAVALDRALNLTGRRFDLARATQVAATVVPADQGRVLVRIDADQRDGRRASLIGAVAGASAIWMLGAVASFVSLVVLGGIFGLPSVALAMVLVMLAAGGIVGGLVLRAFRRSRARVQVAIEQLLDRLEHDGLPVSSPTLLERLDRALR
ncbi:MAG: hypothetical protein MUE41_12975 [Gemmatimonadaceae bacterium]|nr:hypothetical protein [Gemmatimonadaceae bacterium]